MPSPVMRPSTLHLPQGDWATILDCLCDHFPAIDRTTWLQRMARGRVLDAAGAPIDATHPYRVGLKVRYFREVPNETPIPFDEQVRAFEKRGRPMIQSGTWNGVRFAYFETRDLIGTTVEIFDFPAGFVFPEPELWIPRAP